jgi:hypothetical protein
VWGAEGVRKWERHLGHARLRHTQPLYLQASTRFVRILFTLRWHIQSLHKSCLACPPYLFYFFSLLCATEAEAVAYSGTLWIWVRDLTSPGNKHRLAHLSIQLAVLSNPFAYPEPSTPEHVLSLVAFSASCVPLDK